VADLISIVVPCFNEEDSICEFDRRITSVFLAREDLHFELLYINDGSTDATESLLKNLPSLTKQNYRVLVNLSRNWGHQAAIECGMRLAKGDATITIDSDLQDPPELILELIEEFHRGFDVVLAKRSARAGESAFKKTTAKFFYKFIDSLSDTKLDTDVGDFRLLSRRALDSLLRLEESNPYFRGLVKWIGFPSKQIEYARDARYAGETKYSLSKMWNLALSGITSFTMRPLRIPFYASLLVLPVAFIMTLYLIVEKIVSPTLVTPGYTSIVIILLWSFGVQMFTLGVIGEYLAKNFVQTKSRPRYLIQSIHE